MQSAAPDFLNFFPIDFSYYFSLQRQPEKFNPPFYLEKTILFEYKTLNKFSLKDIFDITFSLNFISWQFHSKL